MLLIVNITTLEYFHRFNEYHFCYKRKKKILFLKPTVFYLFSLGFEGGWVGSENSLRC